MCRGANTGRAEERVHAVLLHVRESVLSVLQGEGQGTGVCCLWSLQRSREGAVTNMS